MLDVAASTCGPEVVSFAHSRGYVVLYHYGGSTGVAQVNDTDLHAELSSMYLDLEQTGFHNQQMIDPGNISRSLQAVVDDVCSAWRCCDHRKGVRGFGHGDARLLFGMLLDTLMHILVFSCISCIPCISDSFLKMLDFRCPPNLAPIWGEVDIGPSASKLRVSCKCGRRGATFARFLAMFLHFLHFFAFLAFS